MIAARYDAVVVGGRVAGAATARLLARQGRRVLVLERGRYGDDTLSTHALLRSGVLQLHRWGLLERIEEAGTPRLTRTTFSYGGERTVVEMRPADGIDALYAPRRTVLDPIVVDAAVDAGVEVVFETTMTHLVRDRHGRVVGVGARPRAGRAFEVATDLVIGADGARSRVAEAVQAPVTRRGDHTGLALYAYFEGIETDGNEWHYAPGSAAGVIPTNDGWTCVFAGTRAGRFAPRRQGWLPPFEQLVDEVSPELASRLAAGRRVSRLHAFAGRPGHLRRAHGPGWALVGDAGYFKDPITAHGISDALRDAELLAGAVDDGDLARYERTRDELSADLFAVTDAIASYRWDLDEVRALLLDLSASMQGELEMLRGLPAPALPTPV